MITSPLLITLLMATCNSFLNSPVEFSAAPGTNIWKKRETAMINKSYIWLSGKLTLRL